MISSLHMHSCTISHFALQLLIEVLQQELSLVFSQNQVSTKEPSVDDVLEHFSIECSKTKTKVIATANQNKDNIRRS